MTRLTSSLPPAFPTPHSSAPLAAERPATSPQPVAQARPADSESFSSAAPKDVAMKFYEAFLSKDPEAMAGLYADDVHFKDIIFDARGKDDAMHIWRTLMRNPTIQGTPEFIKQDGDTAHVRVKVKYVFSQTQRPVEREFVAKLQVRDGKIVSHVERGEPGKGDFDHFARQAFSHGWIAGLPLVGDVYEKAIVAMARNKVDEAR